MNNILKPRFKEALRKLEAEFKQRKQALIVLYNQQEFSELEDTMQFKNDNVRIEYEQKLGQLQAEFVEKDNQAGSQLETLIEQKMKANPSLEYAAAFSEVQRERPDLVFAYQGEIQGV